MGIINATPDSFSDGGEAYAFEDAVARGLAMQADGADIIDVGGESTRPGARPVSIDEELARTIPVVERLSDAGLCVSIDTRHALVMGRAVDAGAKIINDVTALTGDRDALAVAADLAAGRGVSIVLMHMQGQPGNMQDHPVYGDVVEEVFAYLAARVEACCAAGISKSQLALDPGIGFGKTVAHNVSILKHLERYNHQGLPIVLGVSRKSFIGTLAAQPDAQKRVPGSLAAALFAIALGANIVRVHDVAATRQALDVWAAIEGAD